MESMTNIPYYITKARFGGYKYPSCPLSLPQSLDDVASLNLTQLPAPGMVTASLFVACNTMVFGILTTTITWAFAPKNAPRVNSRKSV
jgi:hypothetical protein